MTKPYFSIYRNENENQLCGNLADQHLCFCCRDSPITLLPKSEISCIHLFSMFMLELVGNLSNRFSHELSHDKAHYSFESSIHVRNVFQDIY